MPRLTRIVDAGGLELCMYNFSGMHGKGHLVNDLLATTLYGIIICIETHFKSNTNIDMFLAGTQFLCTNKNRASHGGGVAIMHKSIHNFTELDIPVTRRVEVVAVRNDAVIICAIYWPPQSARERCEDIEVVLNFLSTFAQTHHIILAGDFNLSGIKWNYYYDQHPFLIPDINITRPIERDAILYLHYANMQQIIDTPNNRGTFLDLIFTNHPAKCKLNEEVEEHMVYFAIKTPHSTGGENRC